MELENMKTKCVNENENKNVNKFHEFILQQKLLNTKVETQWHEGMEADLFTRKQEQRTVWHT